MVSVISRINFPSLLLLLLLPLSLAGCASGPKRPLFYFSSHEQPVSKVQSDWDTDQCMALARQAGVAENRDGEVGRKAASGALLGGIAAGAWSLVRGGGGENLLAGAVAGGATGAAKGAIDSTEQSPIFRRYVERCLRERGYDVIGWK
ncbi:MAG: cell envelope biogenesis protein OmpA [Chromatiaceae bacterium]|nr:cell envelope biogenesis protein OmpA [Chromatiaceae bacterium]MCP5407987.1 cell envelope biogenesis protein OmpA [Chromatiaceae bacterium]MCP5442886.1 cell envelope biogenesis protein OmpA [Chromatiaceae bacterium]